MPRAKLGIFLKSNSSYSFWDWKPSEFTVFAVEFYAAVADLKVFLQMFPEQDEKSGLLAAVLPPTQFVPCFSAQSKQRWREASKGMHLEQKGGDDMQSLEGSPRRVRGLGYLESSWANPGRLLSVDDA